MTPIRMKLKNTIKIYMKQILQNLRNGKTYIADLPVPALKSQHCLIKSTYSLLSSGTERMLIDFGKSNILNKALSQLIN